MALNRVCPMVAALLLAGPACGQHEPAVPAQDTEALRFISGSSVRIPAELSDGLILVQGRVNDSEPAWFAFDTGATINVLDEAFARQIGLDLSDRTKDERSGRESVRAHGLALRLGGLELIGQTAHVMNLTELELFFGRSFAGIFGYELLRHAVVELDYAGRALVVHQPGAFVYAGPGKTVPLEVVGKWPILSARLEQEGQASVEDKLILDSGSVSALSLMVGGLASRTVDVPVSAGIGGVGAGNARVGRISALTLGPFTFRNPVVMFPPAAATEDPDYLSKAISSTGIGLVGAPVCSRFRLVFDYPGRLLLMEPAAGIDAPFEFDMSGAILMSASLQFDAFRVLAVIKDSPAWQAGLETGDTIVAIDGRPASEIPLARVRELFRIEGVRFTLRVQRAAGPVDMTLVTRRLI